jgi:hypothetical protein
LKESSPAAKGRRKRLRKGSNLDRGSRHCKIYNVSEGRKQSGYGWGKVAEGWQGEAIPGKIGGRSRKFENKAGV